VKMTPLENLRNLPDHALRKLKKLDIGTVEELRNRICSYEDRKAVMEYLDLKKDEMSLIAGEIEALLPERPQARTVAEGCLRRRKDPK
jgi:RecG-like helicase